ncbi:helix-turn-helix transcriptional regulator [Parasphingorhabdus halotolerans]|uniref:Helix-turn-helix transcriptional regulator n=1 Tax=Parasphingorhabdus halotolerans TaxID=2725558 RepID=A0A6H2DND6_9SPHN|nr:helix-turn-helix transcriptional regulator [Parasphingorhabdus halotolerans]QJB69900.1 helix-turn-helix transcriptional regulator [Parasphingorhabdus halotolerans]
MLFFEALLRFSTVAILLVFAIIAFRHSPKNIRIVLGGCLAVSLSGLLLATLPETLAPPEPLAIGFRIIELPNFVLIWLFALALFDDEFRIDLPKASFGIIYIAWMALVQLAQHGLLTLPVETMISALDLASIALMGHLFWSIMTGIKNDLVPRRRAARFWFPFALAVAGGAAILVQSQLHQQYPEAVSLFRVALSLPLAIWGFISFVKLDLRMLAFGHDAFKSDKIPGTEIDPRDQYARDRLLAIMDEEHLYREHGLTISQLAERMRIPEHQLRALINRGLGYRNFSSFLNHYRLAAAKADLSNPHCARKQVLQIAMDVGFGSLASFNRVFRISEGVPPSEYRQKCLAEAEPD